MTTNVLIALEEVLLKNNALPWEFALYIPSNDATWNRDMMCMILDPEETDDPDEDPDNAVKYNLTYALTVSSVQDVVENARIQNPACSTKTLVKALKYYFHHDAFITLK